MSQTASTLSQSELKRFSEQAADWWNPCGAFRSLHQIVPLRTRYVLLQCCNNPEIALPLKGKRVLDMACGGGLMAEALARLGADVTAVDASPEVLEIARDHAQKSGLMIDYREGTAESLAAGAERFDIILAFEILEHVENRELFMTSLAGLLRPGGRLLLSTMNRTRRSYLLGIVAAEYLLRWVPMGTHDWDRFIKPSEVIALWDKVNIEPVDLTGMPYNPLKRCFELSKGRVAVNYFMTGKKGDSNLSGE